MFGPRCPKPITWCPKIPSWLPTGARCDFVAGDRWPYDFKSKNSWLEVVLIEVIGAFQSIHFEQYIYNNSNDNIKIIIVILITIHIHIYNSIYRLVPAPGTTYDGVWGWGGMLTFM